MRDEFMIVRQGRQYVLFAGLLDEAHTRGLKSIDTELLQAPTPHNGNLAVVKATVEIKDVDPTTGEIKTDPHTGEARVKRFSGIGDASPQSVSRNIAPHLLRMAETRAKARALRDAVNVAAAALEEITDGDEAPPASDTERPRRSAGENQSGSRRFDATRPALRDASRSAARQRRPAQEPDAEEQGAGSNGKQGRSRSGSRSSQKARKSQVDLLRTLAEELRGEEGVERLEKRIGKPLEELTRAEADEWIDRLSPQESQQ